MEEPDNRLIESIVAFSEFEDKIKACGLRFDLKVSFWDQGSEVKTLYSSSDPIARQRTLDSAFLSDGSVRVIEANKEVYPPNADLHPENARMVYSRGKVHYSAPSTFDEDIFSRFDEIFKVEKKDE